MSLLSDNIEKEELEIKKDINTVSGKSLLKNKKSLADMIEEKKKKTVKVPVAVYLEENVYNKLKTLSVKTELSVANILETAINELTEDLPIDEKAVKKFDKNNKSRGRKKSTK